MPRTGDIRQTPQYLRGRRASTRRFKSEIAQRPWTIGVYILTFDVQVTIEFFDLAFGTSEVRHHPAVPRSSGRQSAVDGCPASDRPESGDDLMLYAGRQPLICSSTSSFSWQRRWTAGGPGSDTCSTSTNRCIDFAGTLGAARAGACDWHEKLLDQMTDGAGEWAMTRRGGVLHAFLAQAPPQAACPRNTECTSTK